MRVSPLGHHSIDEQYALPCTLELDKFDKGFCRFPETRVNQSDQAMIRQRQWGAIWTDPFVTSCCRLQTPVTWVPVAAASAEAATVKGEALVATVLSSAGQQRVHSRSGYRLSTKLCSREGSQRSSRLLLPRLKPLSSPAPSCCAAPSTVPCPVTMVSLSLLLITTEKGRLTF
jgi:hypothetical protein